MIEWVLQGIFDEEIKIQEITEIIKEPNEEVESFFRQIGIEQPKNAKLHFRKQNENEWTKHIVAKDTEYFIGYCRRVA